GTDLRGLFLIGRTVTFIAALTTTLVLGWQIGRKFGRKAAYAGMLLGMSAAPMIGFSVMVRPDVLAEAFGIRGVFLSGSHSRPRWFAGALCLVLAIWRKQTAALFLLASVLALVLEGRRRLGVGLLLGTAATVGFIVLGVTLSLEPNFARDLLGESTSPW